jgi:AraC-like DNA-binding protein
MSKILDARPDCPAPRDDPAERSPALNAALAQQLRAHLQAFADGLGRADWPLLRPAPAGVSRREGHFHLAPELFLQVSGWTNFRFPHGECRLGPRQALLLPPWLLHDESVGPGDAGEPFCNLVFYADGAVLTCHLAHEAEPGRPGILHLEARRHPLAARLHDWLTDAARQDARGLAPAAPVRAGTAAVESPDWADVQARALVQATLAGLLRTLDETEDAHTRPEPTLIARLRVQVKNQLGDAALSVRRLAEQSGCTADYLSHLFRQSTGEPLVGYINRLRMERAAHLLRQSKMAGKEIAWACGYAAPSYFIRTFRSHFGMTPTAWRAQAEAAVPMGDTERRLFAQPVPPDAEGH